MGNTECNIGLYSEKNRERKAVNTETRPNNLIHEKSPYLKQHAHQPVAWYPWGKEAFERARQKDRPIFLSIGYSTCHWCHVMAHESFEDKEIAQLMNRVFVSVKVDREERPDIDHLYMKVATLLTGGGGWPLSIVITPEGVPFFAATYLPPRSIYGRLGMKELILRIESLWLNNRERINHSGSEIVAELKHMDVDPSPGPLSSELLHTGFQALAHHSDTDHGGLGSAPKFPLAHNLLFLLRYWKRTQENEARILCERSLTAMRLGGIFDHVGFGFHRYSTDRYWLVPHFEKMLYDQALLAMVYSEASVDLRNNLYRKTASEIFDYVFRNLTSPEGAFYSAEDADSEGKEGEFYLWTNREIEEILGPELSGPFQKVFSIKEEGNFTPEHTPGLNGKNILHMKRALSHWSEKLATSEHELSEHLEKGRKRLLAKREQRPHPMKDDKILTDWNGLMIASLARAGRLWGKRELIQRSAKAALWIQEHLTGPDGKLLHRYRENEASIPAFLDDYAYLTWGCIELYQALLDVRYLEWAVQLSEVMIQLFADDNGGFFFTASDGDPLIERPKEKHDGAVPSGNSVAVANLVRLHRLCKRLHFEQLAQKTLESFSPLIERNPLAHIHMLSSLELFLGPSLDVVVVGDSNDEATHTMLSLLQRYNNPHLSLLFLPDDNPDPIRALAPFTKDHRRIGNGPTAYLCRDFTCQEPITDMAILLRELSYKRHTYD